MNSKPSPYTLGSFAGLRFTADRTALIASLVLFVILALAAAALGFSTAAAVVGGLLAVGLHWLSEGVHQLGHASAARRTGYPMIGVRLWWLLGLSKYPPEPPLPASVHIRRALGGPLFSAGLTAIAALLVLATREVGGLLFVLALFFFVENLTVFTLGSFLPLGFTDGSTLLTWWGKK